MNPPVDEYGFFKYAPRVCWHCKASVAHSRQYSALKQAEREAATRLAHLVEMGLTEAEAKVALSHSLTVDGVPASDEELVRVYGPASRRPSDSEIRRMAKAYQPKAFSLLR